MPEDGGYQSAKEFTDTSHGKLTDPEEQDV